MEEKEKKRGERQTPPRKSQESEAQAAIRRCRLKHAERGCKHQQEPGSLLPPPPIQASRSHCSTATRAVPAGPPRRSAGARFPPSRRPWALHGPPLPSGLRGRSSGRGSELVPAQDPDWPAAGQSWRAAALKLAARSSNRASIRTYTGCE